MLLGANNLTVGTNNLSTSFSGGIYAGIDFGGGGSFSKIGTGILTLEGGASNDHIEDTVSLSIATGSTINLNFSGTPDTVRGLIVGGVPKIPGFLTGSAASGAPNQLPQFTGTRKNSVTTFAVSRKTHGAGNFAINLPLTGPAGVECRSGGANNDYQIVVSFLNTVTFSGADVTSGAGSVTSATGSGTTTATVNLTGVTSGQTIKVTLFGVDDGSTFSDLIIPMSVLVGDTTGNGSVNASDVGATKTQSGLPAHKLRTSAQTLPLTGPLTPPMFPL